MSLLALGKWCLCSLTRTDHNHILSHKKYDFIVLVVVVLVASVSEDFLFILVHQRKKICTTFLSTCNKKKMNDDSSIRTYVEMMGHQKI